MVIDTLTITVCGGLVVLAVISSLCNGLFRRPKQERNRSNDSPTTPPQFSIVIATHDNAAALERNLPHILSQDYAPGYEVIVVDESSTDDTEDVLKRLKAEYPHLYTTFIPESSHYLSRRKLALTVGVKAAKNEWLIFTDADCKPECDGWLNAMAEHCGSDTDIIMGYTNYESDSKGFYRFERLLTSCYLTRIAIKGLPYRYNGNNLAIRKSVFMAHNGFLKNLKYLRGEYDFMVNEYATDGRTAIVSDPESFMWQEAPSRKSWTNTGLYYMETRKHLGRSLCFRLLPNIDTFLLHLNYIIEVAAIVFSLHSNNMIMLTAAIVSLIITLVLRIVIAKKAMKSFKENVPGIIIPLFEIKILWHNIRLLIKHRFADKYDFIRK